jgi:DNA repair protein RadC
MPTAILREIPTAVAPGDLSGDAAGRVLAPGPVGLDDAEALQLLCGFTEADARRLLDAFGSLPELLGAAPGDLIREAGPAAAAQLRLVQELACRLLVRPLRDRCVLSSSSALHAYLRAGLVGRPRECFRVLFLDKRNRLIRDEVLAEGTVDHAPVYPREVVRRALELSASAVILCHNHPAGDPRPRRLTPVPKALLTPRLSEKVTALTSLFWPLKFCGRTLSPSATVICPRRSRSA